MEATHTFSLYYTYIYHYFEYYIGSLLPPAYRLLAIQYFTNYKDHG